MNSVRWVMRATIAWAVAAASIYALIFETPAEQSPYPLP